MNKVHRNVAAQPALRLNAQLAAVQSLAAGCTAVRSEDATFPAFDSEQRAEQAAAQRTAQARRPAAQADHRARRPARER